MISEEIRALIDKAVDELGVPSAEFSVEHPEESSHGDYSSNIALVIAKKQSANSHELAGKIVEKLMKLKASAKGGPASGWIEAIEAKGGFINFYLSKEFFADELEKILKEGEKYGRGNIGSKIMVEYTDPNPFKQFHIGHLMSNTIGESIARLHEFSGAEVVRANYQGDIGLHVAKTLWGKLKGAETWGEAYVAGVNAYDKDKDSQQEIIEINKKLYNRSDDELNKLYEEGRKKSLEDFEKIYKKLGTKFDQYFFESEVSGEGLEIVKANPDIFVESEGAIIFPEEKSGLHTRVFINSKGLPTYEAKELGLNKSKFEKYPDLDLSIIITGNEINEYFKVLLRAMELVMPEVGKKTRHVSHGMLRLPSGKMSSRTGQVVTGESLISDVEKRVREKSADLNDQTVTAIAVGAIKYSILKQAPGKDIIFDFEKSLSFEGDSGPYLQYSYARAQSVKLKAESYKLKAKIDDDQSITDIDWLLYRFPEVVEHSLKTYSPNHLVTYLTELASAFNSYYAKNKIVDPDNKETSSHRLALTQAVATVLKNGLFLLGIEAPERM